MYNLKISMYVVFILGIISVCNCHSWVACTNYLEANGEYYAESKCRGYPRGWNRAVGINPVFGGDTGYNYNPTENQACRDPRTSNDYTSQYPMARYHPGQRVCLAWPAKNHVAATCSTPFMPDGGVKIFRSTRNPSQDPTQSQFKNHLVADLGKGGNGVIDFKGFQNCPKFCEDKDKSLCTGCFILPANTEPGVYTFEWYWEFNGGQFYSSCWEAAVGNYNDTLPLPNPTTGVPSSGSAASSTGSKQSTTGSPVSSTGSQSGSSTTGSVTPPVTGSCQFEHVQIIKRPCEIPRSGSFLVDVQYNALANRVIVIDFMGQNFNGWFGKGVVHVSAGKGTKGVTINIENNPNPGNFILKAWIVDAHVFQTQTDSWNREIYRTVMDVQVR